MPITDIFEHLRSRGKILKLSNLMTYVNHWTSVKTDTQKSDEPSWGWQACIEKAHENETKYPNMMLPVLMFLWYIL